MSLDDTNKSGIQTTLLSLMQPAMAFGKISQGRKLAREANELAAMIVAANKGRFGSFATLPYTDTEGSLAEIGYALDTLNAEGFCLMTSYGGKYLGDPSFWPVLEQLNRRKAVIYTHLLAPHLCTKIPTGVAVSAIGYAVDTTRTMTSHDVSWCGGALSRHQMDFLPQRWRDAISGVALSARRNHHQGHQGEAAQWLQARVGEVLL